MEPSVATMGYIDLQNLWIGSYFREYIATIEELYVKRANKFCQVRGTNYPVGGSNKIFDGRTVLDGGGLIPSWGRVPHMGQENCTV